MLTSSEEILTTNDCDQWRKVLNEMGTYDFYHLPAFHRLAEMRHEGEARLWVFRQNGYVITFPMLLRNIDSTNTSNFFAGLKDATCVTGFNGPLASSRDIPKNVISNFHCALDAFLKRERVISVFSRFNPLIDQKFLLEGYGEVIERGVTLSIDLTAPPDVQFARYRKNHQRDITRLSKMGFVCHPVGMDYLEEFVRIYSGTMDRVQAESLYHFDKPYFEYLLREMSDVMHLWACMDGDRVACIWLCSLCNGILGMYLGGNDPAYIHLSPTKLLQHNVSRWGHALSASKVQLGGGVGAKRDSLHNYKMGFGASENVYYTWRRVVDQAAYKELCSEALRSSADLNECSYFPQYRNPNIWFCKALEINSSSSSNIASDKVEVTKNVRRN